MTQPVIQKFSERSCRSIPAKLYIQIASCWPMQAVQLNRRNPADHHSPCRARDPGPNHCGAIFAFYTNSIKNKSEKEKYGKNIASVMESVLLISFAEMFY
jgi:hypothetical protein